MPPVAIRKEYNMLGRVEKTITAEDVFCDPITIDCRKFNVRLGGVWVATVTVQRKLKGDYEWEDVETFTENGAYVGDEPEKGTSYRIGVNTGDFTSGIILTRISY